MDGLDALPDENTPAGLHRDEFACAGIQSEARQLRREAGRCCLIELSHSLDLKRHSSPFGKRVS